MRCLTLARKLIEVETEVFFFSSIPEESWIQRELAKHKIQLHKVEPNSFNSNLYKSLKLDLLIIDSYEIDVDLINEYGSKFPLMAIIDGSDRGIHAKIYLDQNLYNPNSQCLIERDNCVYLRGPRYSLIREEILNLKIKKLTYPKTLEESSIICFSGGSDPNSTILKMAEIVAGIPGLNSTFIANKNQHLNLRQILKGEKFQLLEFTEDFPRILNGADMAFSATGISSWELMTIHLPSVFTTVADNQIESAKGIEFWRTGLVIGSSEHLLLDIARKRKTLTDLLLNKELRTEIFLNCQNLFDGKGSWRVKDEIVAFLN